jgi:hypothetical protein
MKLNLLPTYVSSESKTRNAVVGMVVLIVIGVCAAVFLKVWSEGTLAKAKENEASERQRADDADKESKKADAIMSSPTANAIVRNLNLAAAMDKHNSDYPDIYDKVRQFIPDYFRVTSMSAAPAGEKTCIVTLTGVVSTYQQYADLMLALLRIPGATSVSRSGYQLDDSYIPALTQEDQHGYRIKPGQQNLPDDPLQRLAILESQGTSTGYVGVSGFGGDPEETRGAMPGASLITVQVTIPGELMTPDPRSTLSSSGGAPATGAAGGFGAPPANAAAAPKTGGNPPAPDDSGTTAPKGRGGKGKNAGDDE